MKFKDRTNERYGRLVALRRIGTDSLKKPLWECICDCGNMTNVNSSSLSSKNTTSCGCYLKEQITKHGGSGKGSYNTWRAMVRRCNNINDKDYKNYGALGVTICPQWMHYVNFVADMGEPVGDETLDRINTYGNYEPANCRWAGVKVQNRNVRVRKESRTRVVGVSITQSGKYMAKVTVDKKSYYSKCFNTLEEAMYARKNLVEKYWSTN